MDGGRAFVFDFDHTLFDTDRFFWVDVRAAFARFGIDASLWEESYAQVWPSGYSPEKHLAHLARSGRMGDFDMAAIQHVLRDRFADLRLYLFPDVEPFLTHLQAAQIPCFLVSFGDAAWQTYKVHGAKIAAFFHEVFTTSHEEAKADVVETLFRRFARLAVVDNDPRELDLIKMRTPDAETFWITRVPPEALEHDDPESRERFREARRFAMLPARLSHTRCQTLHEVPL